MSKLTHFNQAGEAHMVDVSSKDSSERLAIAKGYIALSPEVLQLIQEGGHKKGDVLGVARIAGIMASKKTAELIPLCHPLSLSHVDIKLVVDKQHNRVNCTTTVKTTGQTGVEIEALMATQVTLLTLYDMCKAMDRSMIIHCVGLVEKSGGKSGRWQR